MLNRLDQGLKMLLVIGAVFFIAVYAWIAVSRMEYPFDLEWLEGAAASNALRAMNGLPIYVKPTLDYVPEVYTPLYFYFSSLAMRVTGPGFLPLRFVSFFFSLWSMALLFDLARRETGRAGPGLLAAGAFAAMFGACGAWYDLARVDSMFLFFLLLGIWIVRHGQGAAAAAAAGLVAALAFFTKQTALGLFVPLLLWACFAWRRRAAVFAGVAVPLIGGGFLFLDAIHEGWFRYFTVTLPAMDGIRHEMLARFWWDDLFLTLPVASAALLGFLLLTVLGKSGRPARDAWFFLFAGGGMIGLSWLARIHKGGYLNVLMPACALLALALPLGLDALERLLKHRGPALRHGLSSLAAAAVIAQLAWLAAAPEKGMLPAGRWIPTGEDRAAGEAIVDLIAGYEGPVFTPFHCFLPVSAGKRYCGSRGAMMPILYGRDDERRQEFVTSSILAIRRHKYDAIILDKKRFRHLMEAIELYYRQEPGDLIARPDLFRTVTGMKTQPRFLYEPKE